MTARDVELCVDDGGLAPPTRSPVAIRDGTLRAVDQDQNSSTWWGSETKTVPSASLPSTKRNA